MVEENSYSYFKENEVLKNIYKDLNMNINIIFQVLEPLPIRSNNRTPSCNSWNIGYTKLIKAVIRA